MIVILFIGFYNYINKKTIITKEKEIVKTEQNLSSSKVAVATRVNPKIITEQNLSEEKNETKELKFCLKSKITNNGFKYFFNAKGQEYMLLKDRNSDGIYDVNISIKYNEKGLKTEVTTQKFIDGEMTLVTTHLYHYNENNQNDKSIIKGDNSTEEILFEYNEEGYISFVSKLYNGELVKTYENFYVYDSEGHILEYTPTVSTYDSNYNVKVSPSALHKKQYTYNEEGKVMHEILYKKNSKDIASYIDYEYNEDGNLLHYKQYFNKENPNERFAEYFYTYNKDGKQTKIIKRIKEQPYMETRESIRKFEYDKYGNYIKDTSDGVVILKQEYEECKE